MAGKHPVRLAENSKHAGSIQMMVTVQNQKVKDTNTDDYINETGKERP